MSIKTWWLGPPPSAYTSHKVALWFLKAQVRWRFGKDVADVFNPLTDVKTYTQWHFLKNRSVKLGEKALRGVMFIPPRHQGNAKTIRKPKAVYLFHYLQTVRRN